MAPLSEAGPTNYFTCMMAKPQQHPKWPISGSLVCCAGLVTALLATFLASRHAASLYRLPSLPPTPLPAMSNLATENGGIIFSLQAAHTDSMTLLSSAPLPQEAHNQAGNLPDVLEHHQLSFPPILGPLAGLLSVVIFFGRILFSHKQQWTVASSSGSVDVEAVVADEGQKSAASGVSCEPCLCCPICLRPLTATTCQSCALEYDNKGTFIDLTPGSGRKPQPNYPAPGTLESERLADIPFLKQALPVLEQMEKALPPIGNLPRISSVIKGGYLGERRTYGKNAFESPVVSAIYERGWRQNFVNFGFPGPDKEFERAMQWLLPVAKGKTVVDLSCGSGLFTRRFVDSEKFSKVFALDYSENMLQETRQRIDADSELSQKVIKSDLELVRADVSRLPFPSGSISAIHAGAAIHCWPYPSLALSEIARVLSPGGRAVFSTVLYPGQDVPFLNETLREVFVAPLISQDVIKCWEESELRDLCARVGLTGFEAERRNMFIIFKVERSAE